MIWRLVEGQDVSPKWVLNGCPKHGLHLLVMAVEGVANAMPPSIYNANNWVGTYVHHSFTNTTHAMDSFFFLLSRLQQGQYAKGHIGWRRDVAEFMRLSRFAHVFIFRDLRDVAVSYAYHVLSGPPKQHQHPGKDMYRTIEQISGFDGVLSAVIEGVGPFPGVCQLFQPYALWLDEPWTLALRFEDAIADLPSMAATMLTCGIKSITDGIWQDRYMVEKSLFDKAVQEMANVAGQKEASPTFRHGVAGDWREHFTDEHKRQFKQHDPGWLVRLGYEENEDWE